MSPLIDGLLHAWNRNKDYGRRLMADLSDDQLVWQPPDRAVNHPAWIFSHLNAYLPVVAALASGSAVEDPLHHPFGMQSRPESDRSIYASNDELVETFVAGHETVAAHLREFDDRLLERPAPFERWLSTMPTVGIALPYVMLCHENMHLGQLSAWRRFRGLPSV